MSATVSKSDAFGDRSQPLSEAQYQGSIGDLRAQLAGQQKFPIRIPQPHGSRPDETKWKPVVINGLHFRLRYEVLLHVPLSVYEVLVQSGDTQPQRDEDMRLLPAMSKVVQDNIWITN